MIKRDNNGRFLKGSHSPYEFEKGNTPWNKRKKMWGKDGILKKDNPFLGKNHTEETRRKFVEAWKERRKRGVSPETKRKISENHARWNKGKKLSAEARRKMSIAQTGKHKGEKNYMYGKSHSKETKEKIRLKLIGNKNFLGKKHSQETRKKLKESTKKLWKNLEFREKVIKAITGKRLSKEHKRKVSAFHQGIDIKDWKGFTSFEPYTSNWTEEFKNKIRKRDNYTCKICNINQEQSKRKLAIHHIDYNKKNCDPSNLISLCITCHPKTNTNRNYWIEYFKTKQEIKWKENLERFGVRVECIKPIMEGRRFINI